MIQVFEGDGVEPKVKERQRRKTIASSPPGMLAPTLGGNDMHPLNEWEKWLDEVEEG